MGGCFSFEDISDRASGHGGESESRHRQADDQGYELEPMPTRRASISSAAAQQAPNNARIFEERNNARNEGYRPYRPQASTAASSAAAAAAPPPAVLESDRLDSTNHRHTGQSANDQAESSVRGQSSRRGK